MPLMEGVVGSHVKVHIRDFDSQMLAVAHLREKLSSFLRRRKRQCICPIACNILVPEGIVHMKCRPLSLSVFLGSRPHVDL